MPNGFLSLLSPPAAGLVLELSSEPPPVAQPARASAGMATPPAIASRRIERRSTCLPGGFIHFLLPGPGRSTDRPSLGNTVSDNSVLMCRDRHIVLRVIDCVKDLDPIAHNRAAWGHATPTNRAGSPCAPVPDRHATRTDEPGGGTCAEFVKISRPKVSSAAPSDMTARISYGQLSSPVALWGGERLRPVRARPRAAGHRAEQRHPAGRRSSPRSAVGCGPSSPRTTVATWSTAAPGCAGPTSA